MMILGCVSNIEFVQVDAFASRFVRLFVAWVWINHSFTPHNQMEPLCLTMLSMKMPSTVHIQLWSIDGKLIGNIWWSGCTTESRILELSGHQTKDVNHSELCCLFWLTVVICLVLFTNRIWKRVCWKYRVRRVSRKLLLISGWTGYAPLLLQLSNSEEHKVLPKCINKFFLNLC